MRPLWLFLVKHYIFFLFLVLEGVAVSMYINNSYYQRAVVVKATNQFTGLFWNMRSGITQYFALKIINEQLAQQNASLLDHQQGSYIKTDNKIFFQNDTLYRQQYQYITAKVVENTVNRDANYLTLNKGSRNGIKKEMAVICPGGVVGIVHEVSENFSSVISLLHPKTRISAKLKRADYIGTIAWEGGQATECKLKDVPTHVKLKAGDTVVTSGYSVMFPEGIMIGQVKSFDIGKGNDFYDINVHLSTDFNNIRYVYIINNLMKDELEQLQKSEQLP
jgi:rod shape-determining protein MreC